ncbi:MAG: class I SAM-dependent methyltransferase [Planctomycetes bacterium]|nr:class I SAM-dependent methyltransferase [Planctomycetota bacterium]
MTTLHPDQPTCRFLHRWLADRTGQPLRAWSMVAGDGAEARSFAAMCDEYGVDADVIGTDADPANVATAEAHGFAGSASVRFVVGTPSEPSPELGTFDVVLLRQGPDDLDRVRAAEASLRPNGILVLGDGADATSYEGPLERLHPSVFVRSALVHP